MPRHEVNAEDLLAEIERLRLRLQEAEDVLDAIRRGAVDAVVVSGAHGDQVYTLTGADKAYRILYETMNEGAAILTSDGTLFFCNTYLSAMLETPMKSLLGGSLLRFVSTAEASFVKAFLERGLDEPQRMELALKSRNGGLVPCHISTSPFAVEDFSGICMILADLTERKRAESEREKLCSELEAKNEELEGFIYSVSHDLKSPLITIKTFIGFVEQDLASGNLDDLNKDLERISNAAGKMGQQLNQILELSRVGRMFNPPTEIAMTELAHEAVELLSGIITRHPLEVNIAPNLPTVSGDRPRLLEALLNLIENAVKFVADQPHPRIQVGAREEDGEVIFYVQDNGIGIDPVYHDRVFRLFEKLEPNSEGTGIGLALVKRIVEVHGGRIWVESRGDGQGTSFSFTLPRPVPKEQT